MQHKFSVIPVHLQKRGELNTPILILSLTQDRPNRNRRISSLDYRHPNLHGAGGRLHSLPPLLSRRV